MLSLWLPLLVQFRASETQAAALQGALGPESCQMKGRGMLTENTQQFCLNGPQGRASEATCPPVFLFSVGWP